MDREPKEVCVECRQDNEETAAGTCLTESKQSIAPEANNKQQLHK
jgi:hypothetical protein